MPLAELVTLFRDAKHSRLPVYRETLDDPTGLVHVKDVLALLEPRRGGRLSPGAILHRQPQAADPVRAASMRALDLLLKMQASHTHLALVIDEYGGTDGLVSIEDIIEEIVGDIADEHDEETPPLTPRRRRLTSPMPGWSWRISRPRPASIWPPRKPTRMSIRWAGW